MRGVEIWFISSLKAEQFVTKDGLAMFHDSQGDILCVGIEKGEA